MVQAAHPGVLAEQSAGERPGVEVDVDGRELRRGRPVGGGADELGHVLVQRPAQGDVEQLRAPAHPEDGDGAVDRGPPRASD